MESNVEKKQEEFGNVISYHYNKVSKSSAATYKNRNRSNIFQLRKFNNFTKEILIDTYTSILKKEKKQINVLDLCCGRGGDLIKWKHAGINHLFAFDISKDSIDECISRYKDTQPQARFSADFCVADCACENIWQKVKCESRIDLTSCQFALHYAFESYEKACAMLHNACEHLNVGGYFIGIIPNSFEILRHFKKKGFGKISNDIFEIRMDSYENKLFGSVYNFKLDELVDCPEFLIYFPLLKEMLLKYNMRCVKWQSLCHFFLENFDSNFQSLQNMKALKCFNTKELNHLNSSPILDGLNYSHINDSLMKKKMKLEDRPLSLSVEEWQVVRFYSVFVFQRDPPSISPSSDIRLIAVENDKEDTKKD